MFRQKAASYALASMVELAGQEGDGRKRDLCATTIAERRGLPVSYAAKILRQLAKASLLRSDRGPHGGYLLAREPGEITMLEILQAVGAVREQSVALTCRVDPMIQANLDEAVSRAMRELERSLAEVTLQDLLKGAGGGQGPAGTTGCLKLSDQTNSRLVPTEPAGYGSRRLDEGPAMSVSRTALG